MPAIDRTHKHDQDAVPTFLLLDVATFQDQAANPDAAGEVQLSGAYLVLYPALTIGLNGTTINLRFGGATSSFPMLKRSTTELHVRQQERRDGVLVVLVVAAIGRH